jgi:hypothetical protein
MQSTKRAGQRVLPSVVAVTVISSHLQVAVKAQLLDDRAARRSSTLSAI